VIVESGLVPGGAIRVEWHFAAASQVDAAQDQRASVFVFEMASVKFDHRVLYSIKNILR
jgi:hypothetical protein